MNWPVANSCFENVLLLWVGVHQSHYHFLATQRLQTLCQIR